MNDAVRMMIERGVPVIPIVAGTKRPYLSEWQLHASTSPEAVEDWSKQWPNASWAAVATASSIFILDDDSFVVAHMGGVAPDTFVVSSSPGHLQWYFKQTDASREMGAITQPESGGRFSIRFNNQYGIFYGKHPDGHDYEIVNDAPIIEAPDELIAYLRSFAPDKKVFTAAAEEMEYEDSDLRRITSKLMDAFVAHYTLKTRGFATGKWFIACPWESEHSKFYSETETAILLNNGSAGFKCMHGCCKDRGWAAFRKQCEDTRVSGVEKFNFFAAKKEMVEDLFKKPSPKVLPEYPLHVWDGTLYEEYANRARSIYRADEAGIPAAFHIEALKCVVGALVGSGLSCTGYGVSPRFYTILLVGGQGGKGTTIDWATRMFEGVVSAGSFLALLAPPQDAVEFKVIGATSEAFGSEAAMCERASKEGQKRWLQVYEEANTFFEKASISGSGQSLLAATRELFDKERFAMTATSKRKANGGGNVLNSLLAATTFDNWQRMFVGTQSNGSGLFQRLNVIPHQPKIVRKGFMIEPDFSTVQRKLVNKILALEEMPHRVSVSPEAAVYINEWFQRITQADADDDITGRINIIALRNSLHLAWLHGKFEIGVEEAQAGIELADYQLAMRRIYKPNVGENPIAQAQFKILVELSVKGMMTRRDIGRACHEDRCGSDTVNAAIRGLEVGDRIRNINPIVKGKKPKYVLVEECAD